MWPCPQKRPQPKPPVAAPTHLGGVMAAETGMETAAEMGMETATMVVETEMAAGMTGGAVIIAGVEMTVVGANTRTGIHKNIILKHMNNREKPDLYPGS